MNIKNYASEVPVTRSMARIEEMLIEVGATNISKKYEDKICSGITFILYDENLKQTLCFHLQAQVRECFEVLKEKYAKWNGKYEAKTMDQANRTAWKILSDWAELQCSMIILKQATPLQMFLPFVYDVEKEQTLYQKIASGKSKLLLS